MPMTKGYARELSRARQGLDKFIERGDGPEFYLLELELIRRAINQLIRWQTKKLEAGQYF